MIFNHYVPCLQNVYTHIEAPLVEETGVPGENHEPITRHWQALSHNVVLSTPRYEWNLNSQH
jgi:hypothetical protein